MKFHFRRAMFALQPLLAVVCMTGLGCCCGSFTTDTTPLPNGANPGDPVVDGNAADGSPIAAPPKDATVYSYKLDEISPIGDYLPPLDGGRVEMAPPKDWKAGSRQANLVVWFHEYKDSKLLPQIRVTAEDAPADAPQEATVADAKEYADWVDGWVKDQIGDERLKEPVVPLVLGENTFGRYVRAGKYKSSNAERQILITTKGGRVYTIELIVYEGTLKDKQKRKTVLDGYAVGGYMKAAEAASGVGGFELPEESE